MPNSISTTSKTNTNHTPALFKAGDAVLCPFVGSDSYKLFIDDEYGILSFIAGVNKYHTRADGKQNPSDKSPSVFHDTPANRQIINALYSQNTPKPSQRTVIDTTTADDDEVVILPAQKLANMAFDIEHAAETLSDIGTTLALIHYEKVDKFTAQPLARLAHSSADTWAEILHELLDRINESLAQTRYGKEAA